ncbi:uncharacterized protein LOC115689837 [Syzygium oleosum]|uniref:uncharacterized protein LOC115689837 n=1 Tax=Syzygium oleosum TaxID=219896 RepID=UPI0024B9A7CC|nr:uncharacterized protein LOC115689837 [Syzygium oleosum]
MMKSYCLMNLMLRNMSVNSPLALNYLHRVFLMENSNNPQTYPGFRYFPPPSAWIDPNSVPFDDDKTPTWVIVGAVIVVVILCGLLFYSIRWREKKIRKKAAAAFAPVAMPAPPAPPPKKDEDKPKPKPPTPTKLVPPPPPPMSVQMGLPAYCLRCGHRGGRYSSSYTCPQCAWQSNRNEG